MYSFIPAGPCIDCLLDSAGHAADTSNDAGSEDNPVPEGQPQTADAESLMHGDSHVHDAGSEVVERKEGEGGQFQAGDLEVMVHDGQAPQEDVQTGREKFQAGDVEHLLHGVDRNVHEDADSNPLLPEVMIRQEFKSGDAEEMVHGEKHVHDENAQQKNAPFKSGDVEELVHGSSHNVHDPASRHDSEKAKIASAGEVDKLMYGDSDVSAGGRKGPAPSVLDSEHLMHGAGGHDHDVRQLKFLKTNKENKDPFDNIHSILMHPNDDDAHEDEKIRRGKKITYKDIMELGLDEDMMKGVDLKQLLLQDAREYDDWHRDKEEVKGESPEGSFWQNLNELRKRYLSLGGMPDKSQDLTGTKLDPENQKWVTETEQNAGRNDNEDDVIHQLEMLGNTAPLQDRHKHEEEKEYSENGRDLGDL